MTVTLDLSDEILAQSGYVNTKDGTGLRGRGLVHIDDLDGVRLTINEVAAHLKVGNGRLRRYLRNKDIRLANDGKMSLKEVILADWAELKDLNAPGDGLRRATHFYEKSV